MHLARRELHWNGGTVLAPPYDLAADTGDLLLPDLAVVPGIAVMLPLAGRWHQHLEVPAGSLFGGKQKNLSKAGLYIWIWPSVSVMIMLSTTVPIAAWSKISLCNDYIAFFLNHLVSLIRARFHAGRFGLNVC